MNILSFSNSIADLLIGGVVVPLGLYQEWYSWPAAVSCKMWIALDVVCCTASCLSLMLISVDRCYVCVRPIPPRWYRDSTACLIILGMRCFTDNDRREYRNILSFSDLVNLNVVISYWYS